MRCARLLTGYRLPPGGRLPTIPDNESSWDESRQRTRELAEDYLARVEDPELDDKVDIPYPRNHEVAIAQLRVPHVTLRREQ